jgi:Tfp pilus assembly protein PilF
VRILQDPEKTQVVRISGPSKLHHNEAPGFESWRAHHPPWKSFAYGIESGELESPGVSGQYNRPPLLHLLRPSAGMKLQPYRRSTICFAPKWYRCSAVSQTQHREGMAFHSLSRLSFRGMNTPIQREVERRMPDQRDLAMKFMDQNKFSEAIPLFTNLIEANPNDWSLHYMVGQCHRLINNYSDAVESLKIAASLKSDDPRIYLALGIAHQLAGEFSSAINALERAVELEPSFFSAYNSLGLTYRISGDYENALDWYFRAAKGIASAAIESIHKEPDQNYRDEVIDGEHARSLDPHTFEAIREILRSDPTYAIIKNNIGMCFMEHGDIESAREQFKESIKTIPEGYNYPEPYKNLKSIS